MASREKLTIEIDAKILRSLRDLAESEGLELEVLVGEALEDLIAKRRCGKPRAEAIEAYRTSLRKFGPLYQKLDD